MPFVRSFSVNTQQQQPFPFNIPAVKFAKNIILDERVTIFVGDNGSGKSTLLESLALELNLPLIGGHIQSHPSFEAARLLKPFLEIKWGRQHHKGFFFRAEDFSDFINAVERENQRIDGHLRSLEGEVAESVIAEIRQGMNYSLHNMRKEYGENMQAFSHGEAYLKILQTRIKDKGIYLLDEPEAALSPIKQLALISYILEALKTKNTQFIIATHSPILMGIPQAALYEIQEDDMQRIDYMDTEHYRITKTFLDNPAIYLRHLE